MRQLFVQVPRGHGATVLEMAKQYEAANSVQLAGTDQKKEWDLVILHVSNRQVGPLLDTLESLPDLHVSFSSHGVSPMAPPRSTVAEQIKDVTPRSPIEIWLDGLQSIGSWQGFLGYAVAAGIIVWVGMFTSTIYLLIAAMLIAPFAGPAMNVALATARGDLKLLRRSLWRYVVALCVTIIVAAVLSLILRLETATMMMVQISQVSSVAVFLPLVAGAAGALNLVQDENNSLVSGTAVGMLVAASLAPPAGLIGMAGAIRDWEMAQNGLFVLLLQLTAINLTGSLVFRLYGLSSGGSRYHRGRPATFYGSLAITILLLGGLLGWQFSSRPDLQRDSISRRAATEVRQVISDSALAHLVEANLRFTNPSLPGQERLLGTIYVQRSAEATVSSEEIRRELTQKIQQRLQRQNYNVTPLIQVTVLEAPD